MVGGQQGPESRLALTRGITISISGFSCFVVTGSLLAYPLLNAVDGEPGWTNRIVFFGLTALAAAVGCVLGEMVWLLAASRFASRERLQSFVLSIRGPDHPLLGPRRWIVDRLYK